MPATAAPPAPYLVESDIPYRVADGVELKLNIHRRPDVTNGIPILLVHGGGWERGDRTSNGQSATLLAQHGYVVFSIDYRLSSLCIDETNPLCAKASLLDLYQDARVAARWVRAHAGEYKARTDLLGAWGESAGGTLTEKLSSPHQNEPRLVDANVVFSAPTYFPFFNPGEAGYDNVTAVIGCDMSECEHLWKRRSPTSAVAATTAPMFIANSKDEFVPVEGAELMAEILRANKVPVELEIVEGRQHQPHFPEVDAAALKFLERYLH